MTNEGRRSLVDVASVVDPKATDRAVGGRRASGRSRAGGFAGQAGARRGRVGLWVVAWLLVAILLAVGGIMIVPVRGRAVGLLADDQVRGRAELGWGFGVFRLILATDEASRLELLGWWTIPVSSLAEVGKASKAPPKTRRRRPSERRRLRAVAAVSPRVGLAMARRVGRALHLRMFFGGSIGLRDPADAAVVESMARATGRLLPAALELDLHCPPLGEDTRLVGRVSFWISPAELIAVFVVWMVRPDTRRALRALA